LYQQHPGLSDKSAPPPITTPATPTSAADAGPPPPTHESRREKNRRAARAARLRKKVEHEKLQITVEHYTNANAMLKRKNEELQLLIL